jgi:hypothetical protein
MVERNMIANDTLATDFSGCDLQFSDNLAREVCRFRHPPQDVAPANGTAPGAASIHLSGSAFR